MPAHLPKWPVLFLLCGLCGCQSVLHINGRPDAANLAPLKKKAPDRTTCNNAASLLYALLSNEQNLSRLLIIKSAPPELTQLVKTISETAGDTVKSLEAMAAADHGLKLNRQSMPPGDAAARAASGKDAQHLLLHSSGKDLEFQLLLTQVQAMDYGAHLAKVAAQNDADLNRARQFSNIGNQLESLYQLVTDRLRTMR